jgi:hypothetical protein
MSRLSLLLGSAALAIATVGCAHCDTCDDFPAPCTGPNCGAGLYGASAGPVMYPTSAAAPVSSTPGAGPAAGSAAAPTPPPDVPPAAPAGDAPAPASPPVPAPGLGGSTQP